MTDAIITPQAAQSLLSLPNVVVLDATIGVPDAQGAFIARHIAGAQFFDIEAVADHGAPYPHTLPDEAGFAAAASGLGINNDTQLLVYDQTGITFAAARAWWMFRAFGHDRVQVINGGLPAWIAAGLPVEQGEPAIPAPAHFTARLQRDLFRSYDDVESISETGSEVLLDARPPLRFEAMMHTLDGDTIPAHIPGSVNAPFLQMLDSTGGLKDPKQLSQILETYTPADGKHMVVSCNSGITACVLALGLFQAGHKNTAVFDGSWVEWSDRQQIR